MKRSSWNRARWVAVAAGASFFALGGAARGDSTERVPLVKAQLVPETVTIRPGTPFSIAVRFEMADGWHVNWINPGDAGLVPAIEWKLPEGFRVGDLAWPYPSRFIVPELAIFGYEDEVLLLCDITPPASLAAGQPVEIAAHVTWLACSESCVPGEADLRVTMPVDTGEPERDAKCSPSFDRTRASMPATRGDWSFTAALRDRKIVVAAKPPASFEGALSGVCLFPMEPGLIENRAPQDLRREGDTFHITVERALIGDEPPKRLRAVVVSESGWGPGSGKALAIDVPVR